MNSVDLNKNKTVKHVGHNFFIFKQIIIMFLTIVKSANMSQ